jgi:hypothetical protein
MTERQAGVEWQDMQDNGMRIGTLGFVEGLLVARCKDAGCEMIPPTLMYSHKCQMIQLRFECHLSSRNCVVIEQTSKAGIELERMRCFSLTTGVQAWPISGIDDVLNVSEDINRRRRRRKRQLLPIPANFHSSNITLTLTPFNSLVDAVKHQNHNRNISTTEQ